MRLRAAGFSSSSAFFFVEVRRAGAFFGSAGSSAAPPELASPDAAFAAPDVVALPVTEEGLDRLAAHLATELREEGEVRRLADGPYPGSRFYATSRRYSALYTCNTWTADAAQVAGTGVSASGVLLAGQLMDRARAVARRRAEA